MTDSIKRLKELVDSSDNIVFFGGAGVSTESGIPDFRSTGGLYHQEWKYPPEVILSHTFYESNPEEFFRFYRAKLLAPDAKPNAAHKKLAEWEAEGRLKAVITQNIDLPSKGLSPREYQSVKQKVGFDALVNMKCRAYEDLYMAYITPDAREEKLLEHPELFVTPIVRNGREATVGYHPEIWQTWE